MRSRLIAGVVLFVICAGVSYYVNAQQINHVVKIVHTDKVAMFPDGSSCILPVGTLIETYTLSYHPSIRLTELESHPQIFSDGFE